MKSKILAVALVGVALVATGCSSDADKAANNISKAAEQFEVQRSIVGVNGITDRVVFEVEGRCSIEGAGLGGLPAMTVTCKHGPKDYRKHYITVPDNLILIATQLRGIDVSVYHTRIILKPQNIVPNFDLVTGGD